MQSTQSQIGTEIKTYTEQLESLYTTLPQTMVSLQRAQRTSNSDVEKYIANYCTVVEENENGKTISIKDGYHKGFRELKFQNDNIRIARLLVPRGFIITMVSQYDAYLGKLLKEIYLNKPEIISNTAKNYNYSDIVRYQTIDEFKHFAVDKEIESIIRESHSKQFDIMQDKFGLKLRENLSAWSSFIEITERRNLFVHADGVVSKQYISVCGDHKHDTSEVLEGQKLQVSHDYFKQSFQIMYEIGVKLGQVLWRKLFPSDIEEADENLISVTYDLIEREQYNLACNLLDMALRDWDKKISNDLRKSVMIVNCAQSHKWAGRTDRCNEIMKKQDWSAKDVQFKLADSVLSEKWGLSKKFMMQIGASGPVSKFNYRDWPLFKEFRETEEFQSSYFDIFQEKFGTEQSTEQFDDAQDDKLSEGEAE